MKISHHAVPAAALLAAAALWVGSRAPSVAASPAEGALPSALVSFVRASHEQETECLAGFFSPDAVVYDGGEIVRGAEEIRKWVSSGFQKYRQLASPAVVLHGPHELVLTTKVHSTSAPATLRLHCRLVGDKIGVLIIQPAPATAAVQ